MYLFQQIHMFMRYMNKTPQFINVILNRAESPIPSALQRSRLSGRSGPRAAKKAEIVAAEWQLVLMGWAQGIHGNPRGNPEVAISTSPGKTTLSVCQFKMASLNSTLSTCCRWCRDSWVISTERGSHFSQKNSCARPMKFERATRGCRFKKKLNVDSPLLWLNTRNL